MENMEDTLSINHNWLNGFNIAWGWALLERERSQAAAAIEDCRCAMLFCSAMLEAVDRPPTNRLSGVPISESVLGFLQS